MDVDGSNQTQITDSGTGTADLPSFGPVIAFRSDRDGTNQIYTCYWVGSHVRQLTKGPQAAFNLGPSFSPDGTRIASYCDRASGSGAQQNIDIFVMYANGANVSRLTTDPSQDEDPAFGL